MRTAAIAFLAALAGTAALASAAFFAIPMVDYALTWWKLVFW